MVSDVVNEHICDLVLVFFKTLRLVVVQTQRM